MKKIIYLLIFLFSAKNIAQFSEEHIVTTEAINPRYVDTADINGDGFIDIIVASFGDDTLAWYENLDGLGNFGTKNVITSFLDFTQFVSTADIDGDGDIDVLATTFSSDLIVWYENLDGLGNFSLTNQISINKDAPLTVFAADLDGDGDMDTYSSSKFDSIIAWYENTDGLGDFSVEHIISNQAFSTTWAFAADLDNDGDLDMLATAAGNNQSIFWYENDGFGNFGTENLIVNGLAGPQVVIADDMDGDGDLDVLSVEFGGETIAWYENTDGLGNFGIKQIITTEITSTRNIKTADIDNDGDQDVVLVSTGFPGDKVAWHANDGSGNFGIQQVIDNTAEGSSSISVADFDNDGYQDIVYSSIIDYKVAWYKNETYLSINDNILNTIVLSPNPTNGLVTINAPNSIIVSIEVYDMLGKQIFTFNLPANAINLSDLQAGMYLVKIKTEQGSLVKKIIKE